MSGDKSKKEVIGFSFPKDRIRELRQVAENENRSVAGLIRKVILEYLEKWNRVESE